MGDYDAACVAKSIIAQMAEAGAVNAEDFKIIGSSDIIPVSYTHLQLRDDLFSLALECLAAG